MFVPRIRAAALALTAGLSLSACVYNDGFGYGGISVGYGSAGYYDDYYDPYFRDYYGRSSYGYRPYFGWYDGFYYPGTGYYVYDRYRRPYRWNDYQRRYWLDRGRGWHGDRRSNWSGLGRHFRQEERQFREHARQERNAFRRGELSRDQFRAHRREERRAFREHRLDHFRDQARRQHVQEE